MILRNEQMETSTLNEWHNKPMSNNIECAERVFT